MSTKLNMIPKKIHYIWLGGEITPPLVQQCIGSWHTYMPEPEWQYYEWNERTIENYCVLHNLPSPLCNHQYCQEAYETRKFAFVSDYIRLWALEREGGLYMDVDFEVYQSFEPLLSNPAFGGYEGCKRKLMQMGVFGTKPHGEWITRMLHVYDEVSFLLPSGFFDQTTIACRLANYMEGHGLVFDGNELDWCASCRPSNVVCPPEEAMKEPILHIYPVDYFCPVLTTGEDVRSENTYCEHKGLHSWSGNGGIKAKILNLFSPKFRTRLIKLKRKIVG